MNKLLMSLSVMVMTLTTPVDAHDGYFFAGVGLGANDNWFGCSLCWEDAGGVGTTFFAGYAIEVGDDVWTQLEYRHFSQIDEGPPWNDNDESSLDTLYITIEKRW